MSEHPRKTIGVVIVHGVGNPKPGETLDTLVESLCDRNASLSVQATSRRVLAGRECDPEFEVPQRRLVDTSGTTILMSEVFWGDVGRVSESWWGIVSAVVSLAMGLHALIFAGGGVLGSPAPRGHLPRFTNETFWLRATFWTALTGAYHIKGVLAPLAVSLMTLGAWSIATSNDARPPSWSALFVLVLVGLLSLSLPPPSARKVSPPGGACVEPPERWMMPTVAAGVWCVVGYVVPACGLLIASMTLGPSSGWGVGLALSLAFGLCHLGVILFTERCAWRHTWLRYLKLFGFWGASIPWFWLAVFGPRPDSDQRMNDLGALLMSAYHAALGLGAAWVFLTGGFYLICLLASTPKERKRGTVIFLGYAFEFTLWVTIVTTLAWLAWKLPDHERLTWLGVAKAYGEGTSFSAVPLTLVVSLAISLWLWGWLWKPSNRRAKPAIADLVSAWPLPLATSATALFCLVAAALNWGGRSGPAIDAIVGFVLTSLVAAVRWRRTSLQVGLDLATDVTEYFRGRSWASSQRHRTHELLKTRFRAVVNDLDVKVDRLVVVAHSQGTVIAVDALRSPASRHEMDLLTMGSPLRSLYKWFFPVEFWDLVAQARPNVTSWVNLYRADDYVGRTLRLRRRGTDKQIAGQGHEHYWTDASVLHELESLIWREPVAITAPK